MPDNGNEIQNHFFHAIRRTLQSYFTGQHLTNEAMLKLSSLIAGNLPTLRVGSPVPLWTGQEDEEWVLLFVMSARRSLTPRRKLLGGKLLLQVMCGPASGQVFEQFFTDRALQRLARHIGMMNRRSYRRPHPTEFGQMKFAGKLVPGEKLSINEYWERPSLNKRNRDLLKKRGPGKRCPRNYVIQCYACPVGFLDCPLGTHKYTFTQKHCSRCGELGYFDPDNPGQRWCQHCLVTLWRSSG